MSAQPWDQRELDLIRHLAACRCSPKEIADALALAGFPAREESTVQTKGNRLGVKWQGDRKRG